MIIPPYRHSTKKLKESKEIKSEKELIKLKLISAFLKITAKMKTEDILLLTKLHKSDLSRIRVLSLSRFTIDRIVSFLELLGHSTEVKVRPKKIS